MTLDIITPDQTVFSGEVSSVTVPGTLGQFQVLNNHAPIISTLSKGDIKIKSAEGEQSFQTGPGVVEVLKNKIIVLVERVENPQAS